jgi:hypothetical protein
MGGSTAVLIIVFVIGATLNAQTRIDGDWWKEANRETRTGVVNGAVDCLLANQGVKLPRLKIPALDQDIDAAFAQSSGNETLASVLLRLPKESGPGTPGGEDYSKEKHGWFDGYYWGSASVDEQIGFLIGYLSCGNKLPTPVEHVKKYRDEIDSWYGKHPSSNAKIADVVTTIRRTVP